MEKDWNWIQHSHGWIWEWGDNNIYDVIGWYLYELNNNGLNNDNQIGDSGGCSIGEALKMNSTLTELNLGMRGVNYGNDEMR